VAAAAAFSPIRSCFTYVRKRRRTRPQPALHLYPRPRQIIWMKLVTCEGWVTRGGL
jgi:hypothetical protein